MKPKILSAFLLFHFVCGSLITSKSEGEDVEVEWTADDMPDPRYDPESCGISSPGWICDPDGVFNDTAFGGGPGVVDKFNSELWGIANKSECPCQSHDCYTHDVIILVAVVKKLKNPDGKSGNALLTSFAKKLQEDVWKADDTDCQQEIVIASSVEDEAITTEIGEDILRSKMIVHKDVRLISEISHSLHEPHDLVGKVKYIAETFGLYVDHPPFSEDNFTTAEPVDEEQPDSYKSVLPPAVIASIVIGVLIFLGAIVILILAPAVCHTEKWCMRYKR